jgi:hypothetical protein
METERKNENGMEIICFRYVSCSYNYIPYCSLSKKNYLWKNISVTNAKELSPTVTKKKKKCAEQFKLLEKIEKIRWNNCKQSEEIQKKACKQTEYFEIAVTEKCFGYINIMQIFTCTLYDIHENVIRSIQCNLYRVHI